MAAIAGPDGREYSFGEVLSECNRVANGLRAKGLQTGDTIALMLPNCVEFLIINLAVQQSGLYMVPMNWHLAGPEVAYILQDSDAKVFIAHEQTATAAAAAAAEAGLGADQTFAIGEVPGFQPLAGLSEGQPDTLPAERTAGAVMNYTSGTTGKPKGVRRALTGLDPGYRRGAVFLYRSDLWHQAAG